MLAHRRVHSPNDPHHRIRIDLQTPVSSTLFLDICRGTALRHAGLVIVALEEAEADRLAPLTPHLTLRADGHLDQVILRIPIFLVVGLKIWIEVRCISLGVGLVEVQGLVISSLSVILCLFVSIHCFNAVLRLCRC